MASGSGQAVLNTRSPANGTEANGGGVVSVPGATATELSTAHISTDLKQLVSILGQQAGSGISLEQLLSSHRSSQALSTPTPSQPSQNHHHHHPPTTPSGPTSSNWTPSTGGSRKRGRGTSDTSATMATGGSGEGVESLKRRRSAAYKQSSGADKQQNKGLRHFSQRVCEKVRQKGTTTYNEVADELVKELAECEKKDHTSGNELIDHKNIRRRVYDALNVLMAMNIIAKEKKEIHWLGLPTNSAQECQHIEEELAHTEERIRSKREEVENLLVQILSFKNLMRRNRDRLSASGAPAQNSAISLPFIIVNTNKKTTIDCSISSDKSEYVFNFDSAFELHNDVDVLKKMGLDCGLHSGCPSPENLRTAKAMLPKAFENTLTDIVQSRAAQFSTSTPVLQTPTAAVGNATLTPSPASQQHTPSSSSTGSLTPAPITTHTPTSIAESPLAISSQIASRRTHQPKPPAPSSSSTPSRVHSSYGLTMQTPARSGSPMSVVANSLFPNSPGTPQISSASRVVAPTTVPSVVRGLVPSQPLGSPGGVATPPTPTIHSSLPGDASPLTQHQQLATSSPIPGKSPVATTAAPKKIVTVKKLDTSEQINSILQQLQQNNHLLKQIPIVNAAAGSSSSLSSLLSGSPTVGAAAAAAAAMDGTVPISGGGGGGRVIQPRPIPTTVQSQVLSALFPNGVVPTSSPSSS